MEIKEISLRLNRFKYILMSNFDRVPALKNILIIWINRFQKEMLRKLSFLHKYLALLKSWSICFQLSTYLKLKKVTPLVEQLRVVVMVIVSNDSVRLPIINLPTFDGSYAKWLEFRDTFKNLIHDKDSIVSINKFHYLRNSL